MEDWQYKVYAQALLAQGLLTPDEVRRLMMGEIPASLQAMTRPEMEAHWRHMQEEELQKANEMKRALDEASKALSREIDMDLIEQMTRPKFHFESF